MVNNEIPIIRINKLIKNSVDKNKINEKSNNNKTKPFLEILKKYVNIEERLKYLIDDEINFLDYNNAIEIDIRTFKQCYISFLMTKHLLLFTFINKKDYNLPAIKYCLFICSFCLYFTVNTFFFDDETMHRIYIEEGVFNIVYQIPHIIYSSIISVIITLILKSLSLSQKNILYLGEFENIHKAKTELNNIYKSIKIKFIIFIFFGFLLLLFGLYYLSTFYAVYKNTQIHLIKDISISFILSMITPFVISLIPSLLRISSLKDKIKKNKKCIYDMSKVASII